MMILLGSLTILNRASLAQNDDTDDAQYLIESTANDLGSTDQATADKAEQQLIGIGEPAVPALQKVMTESHSDRVRKRAQKILWALEGKFKLEPTRVTLKMEGAAPEKVLSELSRIGGVWIGGQWDFWGQNRQSIPSQISVDFQNVPFVQALDDVCAQSRLGFMESTWSSTYQIQPMWGGSKTYPKSDAGIVRYWIDSIQRNSSIDLSDKKEGDDLSLELHAITDPKLPVVCCYSDAVVSEAICDTGDSLVRRQDEPNENKQWSSSPFYCCTSGINLQFKTGNARFIKSLKGAMRFAVAAPTIQIVFDHLADGQTVKHGTFTVKLQNFSQEGNDAYQAQIVVSNSTAAPTSWNGPTLSAAAQLYDANGMPYFAQGQGGSSSPTEITSNMRFALSSGGGAPSPKVIHPGKATKLVVVFSESVRTVRVPFEFTNIPIPSPSY
jgi:hypothetical protein